ncbi:MAG: hypothetical protein JWN01_1055 [Patescibacteria group bacterium]|nr:hypothetical protein [Patescibacteria group bacterium]
MQKNWHDSEIVAAEFREHGFVVRFHEFEGGGLGRTTFILEDGSQVVWGSCENPGYAGRFFFAEGDGLAELFVAAARAGTEPDWAVCTQVRGESPHYQKRQAEVAARPGLIANVSERVVSFAHSPDLMVGWVILTAGTAVEFLRQRSFDRPIVDGGTWHVTDLLFADDPGSKVCYTWTKTAMACTKEELLDWLLQSGPANREQVQDLIGCATNRTLRRALVDYSAPAMGPDVRTWAANEWRSLRY